MSAPWHAYANSNDAPKRLSAPPLRFRVRDPCVKAITQKERNRYCAHISTTTQTTPQANHP